MAEPRLSSQAIEEGLRELEGWRYTGQALERRFEFPSFVEAFGWMTSVALHAEHMDHHPDWKNVYNRVEVHLTTHDSGGVTAKDLRLAKIMSALARAR
jgi:4a-hydroxytetrahydrobiopterin dehydratase